MIFSPFSSLGELTYAEEHNNAQVEKKSEQVATEEEIVKEKEEEEPTLNTKGDPSNAATEKVKKKEAKDGDDPIKKEGGKGLSEERAEEIKEDSDPQDSLTVFGQPQANSEDDYEWEDNGDGTVTITEYTGTNTNIVIPDELDGKPVTVLGNRSFHQKNIQSIKLPDTIKVIDISAFSNNQLTSIDLPDGLENINDTAFYQNKLTSVEIPSSVEWIGNHTFLYNEFTSIAIYGKNTYIVSSAFDRVLNTPYENLTVYGFANSTAETYANKKGYTFEPFEGTAINIQVIDDIEVPFGMEREDLPLPEKEEVTVEINRENKIIEVEIDWDEGTPIYDQYEAGTYLFEGELLLDSHIKNPNNLTAMVNVTVLPLQFEWSDNGDGTVTITKYNGSDKDVFIPKQINGKDVTVIGERVFEELGLTKVTLPNTLKTIGDSAFFNNSLTAVNIPEGVTSLGEAAFRQNKLETVTFPNTLETIGDYAFTTNKLTEIELPDSVTDIGIWAFRWNELESIKFSKNLSEIPGLAFQSNQLKQIEIPDFVEEVSIRAFENNNLEEVIIYNENLDFGENVFAHDTNDPQDVVIKGYKNSTAETYATANDHTFDPFVEIPDENLKRVIYWRLGKTSTSEITATDLEGLAQLEAYQAGIVDLTGLQYATNLTRLSLESNNINNISALEGLTNLESIDLAGNEISDISPVKDLANLQTLLIGRNDISDISSLENMTNLNFLELSYNNIEDITPLKKLTNLEILLLSKIDVTDFSALNELSNLVGLSLADNNISDISLLKNFTNLEWISLETNKIDDISVLKNLTNLEGVFLANNKISDLSPLGSYFNNLQDGSLDDQEVTLPTIKLLDTTTTLELDNPIIFHDGSIIDDITVQDGTYDSPKIKWNVTGTETERVFTFSEQNFGFSGTVIQPIEWVVDELPVIHATDHSILLNEPFDPLDGVTATDKESGDLTNDITIVKNEVDSSQLGTYEVTYSVTDDGGQTVEKTITVTVTELDVTDIETVSDISVSFGTTKNDIGLPEQINVDLNNGATETINVAWDDGDPKYDRLKAGTYTFTGTLQLPAGVANSSDYKVSISIHVEEFILPVDKTVQTEVFAGTVATIANTNTTITFPDDLPAGTLLTVVDVSSEDFVTDADGIEVAGDVLDFIFHYPSGESFNGSFILTMMYNENVETEVDIYYYNEDEEVWAEQEGLVDETDRTITIEPAHFSIYGVFAKASSKDDDEEIINGKGGPADPGTGGQGINGKGGPGDKDDVSATIGDSDDKVVGQGDKKLPSTATKTYQIIFIGFVLLMVGSVLFYVVRQRVV